MNNNANKKVWFGVFGVVIFAILFITLFIINRESPLLLQSTSPPPHDQKAPQNVSIVFTFNKQLDADQPDNMQIRIAPSIDFETVINDNAIELRYDTILLDQTTYNISIANLRAHDGSVLELASNTFTVEDTSRRGQFLRSLPLTGDGYTLARLSTDTIYAQITKAPIEDKAEEIYELLAENDITETDFVIKIEALRSLRGAGAPPEPTQPLPPGE